MELRYPLGVVVVVTIFAQCFLVYAEFLKFQRGYEYVYTLKGTAELESTGTFSFSSKISFTSLKQKNDSQELFIQVYGFRFSAEGSEGGRGHDLDFSKWFSFTITTRGRIDAIYYARSEKSDVFAMKKGFAALFSSDLRNDHEIHEVNKDGYRHYKSKEVGHEGPHGSYYIVIPTETGKAFKKRRTVFKHPIKNAKSSYEKTLHYDNAVGTIHKVNFSEKFSALNKESDRFDPYYGMRPVQAVNHFDDMDTPEIKSSAAGELTFLMRQKVQKPVTRPKKGILQGTLHTQKKVFKRLPIEKNLDLVRSHIEGNLTCLRIQPEKGSPQLLTCAQNLVWSLKTLPDDELKRLSDQYIPAGRLERARKRRNRKNFVDALGALQTPLAQEILVNKVLLSEPRDEKLMRRTLVLISAMEEAPQEIMVSALESLPSQNVSVNLKNCAHLTLGSVVHKLNQHGQSIRANGIVDRLHHELGYHDPWLYRQKRATFNEKEESGYNLHKVILLETLGNARMPESFHYIKSHINATNSPWIKRAGISALRHYHHSQAAGVLLNAAQVDEDDNVRYEAFLQFKAHPFSNISLMDRWLTEDDMCPVDMLERQRRSLLDFEIAFKLEAPGVDWQKRLGTPDIGASFGLIMKNLLDLKISLLSGHLKLVVHDEAYARVHIGYIGVNLDFFRARLCFQGGVEYNLNIFQEFDPDQGRGTFRRFESVAKSIVERITEGVELFRKIINGDITLSSIVEDFVDELLDLPNKVLSMRKTAASALTALAEIKINKLPPFVQPVREFVTYVTNFFNDAQTDVLTFFNGVVQRVTVIIPNAAKQIFTGITEIIDNVFNLFKDPKTAIGMVAKGVFRVAISIKRAINATMEVKRLIEDADGNKYWTDLGGILSSIAESAADVKEKLAYSGTDWVEEQVEDDKVAKFTKGKKSMRDLKSQIVQNLQTMIDDLLGPFSSLSNLGKFIKLFKNVVQLIKDVKNAFELLKNRYKWGRSVINKLFGSTTHKNFPNEMRESGDGCSGYGVFISRLGSGDQEYKRDGVDLVVSEGALIVAPFAGKAQLTENDNEVVIITDGDLPDGTEIFLTNVAPRSVITHPDDPLYTDFYVSKGDLLGTATKSACTNHIHMAILQEGSPIDPTKYLDPRLITIPMWKQLCNDYKLVFKGVVIEEGTIPDAPEEETDTQVADSSGVQKPEDLDMSDDGQDTEYLKNDDDGFFKKMSSNPVPSEFLEKDEKFGTPGVPPGETGGGNWENSIKVGVGTLLNKTAAFLEKFSLKKLKLGAIVNFLEVLEMDETKRELIEVLQIIKELSSSKPCVSPEQMSDDELEMELMNRGLSMDGSREDVVARLTNLDSNNYGLQCTSHYSGGPSVQASFCACAGVMSTR